MHRPCRSGGRRGRARTAPLRLPLRAFGGLTPLRELLAEPADEPVTAVHVDGDPSEHPPGVPEGGDVVERLERLAALHDRGAIDDEEYETAKDAVLHEEQDR